MRTLQNIEGPLELILGTGWISAWELENLKAGDIVNSSTEAGTGFELWFGGSRIASVDCVVVGGERGAFLCPRIRSLERNLPVDPEPDRGHDLTELLPFVIRLGKVQCPLSSLSGLGTDSVLNLGIDAPDLQGATLVVAGTEFATGIVTVMGESMGMRVTRRLLDTGSSASFSMSGSRASARVDGTWGTGESPKDYCFRRPDFFTRKQLSAISRIHVDFAAAFHALTAKKGPSLDLAEVDQLNFTEFAESLADGETVCTGTCTSLPRPLLPESERPGVIVADLAPGGNLQLDALRNRIEESWNKPRSGVIFVTGAVVGGYKEELFKAIRTAWRNNGALSPWPGETVRHRGKSTAVNKPALEYCDVAGEWEMLALVSFRVSDGSWLNVAYLDSGIRAVLGALL